MMQGFRGHMSYEEFLLAAAQKKADMDKLEGVCHLRKDEDSLRNDTELYRMQVAEQTKRGQDFDDVGPTNVGAAYLVRQINDPSKMCKIPNYKKTTEERIEEELDRLGHRGVFRGVCAANADDEDVYSAVE